MELPILVLHVSGGSLAILAGYVAICVAKGASLHRRSGTVFVYAMALMGLSGLLVALLRDKPGSMAGGPLAAYFTITALTTVRPVRRAFEGAMLVIPTAVGILGVLQVAEYRAAGRSVTPDGVPVAMLAFLSTICLIAAVSDVRVLRTGPLTGASRIARHLWRMCFAFWMATGSFFLGQMDEFPAALQQPALMAIPALVPLVAMLYWLWRVRLRRRMSGLHTLVRHVEPLAILPAQHPPVLHPGADVGAAGRQLEDLHLARTE